jgi:hypothetical protein
LATIISSFSVEQLLSTLPELLTLLAPTFGGIIHDGNCRLLPSTQASIPIDDINQSIKFKLIHIQQQKKKQHLK